MRIRNMVRTPSKSAQHPCCVLAQYGFKFRSSYWVSCVSPRFRRPNTDPVNVSPPPPPQYSKLHKEVRRKALLNSQSKPFRSMDLTCKCTSGKLSEKLCYILKSNIVTTWSRVRLEKLPVAQLLKNFPVTLWNPKIYFVFTRAPHLFLSCNTLTQSIPGQPILRRGRSRYLFPSAFPIKILCGKNVRKNASIYVASYEWDA
jgi:hypothetical protein